jgi:anti-sigma B factor antagonist
MEITQRLVDGNRCVVTLNGTLNAASSDQLKESFRRLVAQGIRLVVVDLGKVHFIDSSGLAALISGLKTLGGDNTCLKLAGLQPQAQLLFKITMFDKVFEVHPDVDAALKACRS